MTRSIPQAAGLCCLLSVLSAGCGQDAAPAPPASHATQAAPASAPPPMASHAAPTAVEPVGYTGPLPELPTPAFAIARPPSVVRAVYEFAARHPEVLRYVPCFCGCESRGHQHNDDCFISGRDADGRPQWEMHGMG